MGDENNQNKPAPTWDSVAKDMGAGVERALATGDVNAALPDSMRQPSTQPPPPVEPPVEPPVQQQPPAVAPTGQPVQPPPATDQGRFITVDAFQPVLQGFQQMAQTMWQQNQMLIARLAPAPSERQAVDELQMPKAVDVAKTFIPPDRGQGESDAAYAARSQGAMLDHLNTANQAHFQKVAERIAEQRVADYRAQVEQQQTQARGQQAFESALDGAVRANGVDPSSPHGQFIRQQSRANMIAYAAANDISRHGPQQMQQLMHNTVSQIKGFTVIPPTPGQPPNLTVVPGGGAAPGARPVAVPTGGGGPATNGTVNVPPSGQPATMSSEEARKPGAFAKVFEGINQSIHQAIKRGS